MICVIHIKGVDNMIDREYLYNNYIVKNKSQKQIAKELDVSDSTVSCWIRKYKLSYKNSIKFLHDFNTMLN